MAALFTGRESLRVRGERTTFVWTLLTLPVTVVVLGWVLQHAITWQEIALLVVVAMVYVSFARGRLLGGGLRVHAGQFGHVHAIVDDCARRLRMPTPHVFVRDDPFVPVVAIGIGEPYAVVLSAQHLEEFGEGELRFLIGRELGHIAAGHTRFTSLLSANGRETGVIALAFGAWLRRIDYTADRIGLLCCGSLEAAMRAIAVSTFGTVGHKVDLGAFAEQLKELHAEPSLRLAEWTASTPYATNRIAALHRFARDPLYAHWAQRFAENATAPIVTEEREAVYAGFWRRMTAFLVDCAVVQAIVRFFYLGNGAAVLRVRNDHLTGVHQSGGNIARQECGGDNHARQPLTVGNDIVGGPRSELSHGGDSAQQLVERVELETQLAMQFGVQAGAQQLAGCKVVPLAKPMRDVESLLALAPPGGSGHGQQLVGNLGHGADHDEWSLGQPRFHDAGDAIDGCGVLD